MFKSLFKPETQNDTESDSKSTADYVSKVAPASLELHEDHIAFPYAAMLPLTVRAVGVPGMQERPWAQMSYEYFYKGAPVLYSLSIRRHLPDTLKSSLKRRRTIMEGTLLALAQKTGRRPSIAENMQSNAMDEAESALVLGAPAYEATTLCALYARGNDFESAERTRKSVETRLKAAGMQPQRLEFIPERALQCLQPGGNLFPKLDEPTLFQDEALRLLPPPTRQVFPADDSIYIGTHAYEGRDVFFSSTMGLDPTVEPPSHAINLILGEQGARKTTLLRWMALQNLMQGRTVLTIDPEGENNVLCEAVGGVVVPAGIPEDKDVCLLHPLQAENPSEMLLAVRFLMSVLAGEAALTPTVNAVLHEAVQAQWERAPGRMSVTDLRRAIATVNSPDIAMPLAILKEYQRDGINAGFFDRPRALLDMKLEPSQWYNFDLSGLREANRNIIHAILSWFIYNVVTVGKQPMDIFIDEGWRLFRNAMFADLLDELGRRARKRGICVSLVTHLPSDLARNKTSLSMASTAFIGRMGPDDARSFFLSLGVTESEATKNAKEVSHLQPGTFMAAPSGGRGALFPVSLGVPPLWIEFWRRIGATGFVKSAPQQHIARTEF